jgi:5'-deoxynucleotidase YfbR-like HD superfamily hydrolase
MNAKDLAKKITPAIIELSKLCLQFARINRVTYKDESGTPESDTDHTFMLSMIACSVASRYLPELDLGKVSQYALIHDFIEVYAGDQPTVFLDQKLITQKKVAEDAALARLEQEFEETFPWITSTIRDYESLSDPEARFVKIIDKIMPALTHLQDNGLALNQLGVTSLAKLEESVGGMSAYMKSYSYDQDLAMAIRDEFTEIIRREVFDKTD